MERLSNLCFIILFNTIIPAKRYCYSCKTIWCFLVIRETNIFSIINVFRYSR